MNQFIYFFFSVTLTNIVEEIQELLSFIKNTLKYKYVLPIYVISTNNYLTIQMK